MRLVLFALTLSLFGCMAAANRHCATTTSGCECAPATEDLGGEPVTTCDATSVGSSACCNNASTGFCHCTEPRRCVQTSRACECGSDGLIGSGTDVDHCEPAAGTVCCLDPSLAFGCTCGLLSSCGASDVQVSSCTAAMLDTCGAGQTAVPSCS